MELDGEGEEVKEKDICLSYHGLIFTTFTGQLTNQTISMGPKIL